MYRIRIYYWNARVYSDFLTMGRAIMRSIVIGSVVLILLTSPALAQYGSSNRGSGYPTYGTGSNPYSNSVDGYTRRDGSYVAPHTRTNPNATQYDNYNSRGNYNPYSGSTGTRSPRY